MVLEIQIINAVISIVVAVGIFYITKAILLTKFPGLSGIQKLTKLIGLAIIGGELVFLGQDFGLFVIAAEIIASIGVGFGLLSIAFQSYLKNFAAGLGNYLNSDINIGDMVELAGTKGVIVDLGLTKTTIMLEDGARLIIPNLKFNENEYRVFRKKKPCEHLQESQKTIETTSDKCAECVKQGKQWVALRMCLTCGHVGCDRTSEKRHAEKHFRKTKHPVIVDLPEKKWYWCYIHNSYF
jgi:moderate conductance mechanosensitive channel